MQSGKFEVSRETKAIETEALDPGLIFEQEPSQILDSLLPLYLNAAILRSLQVWGSDDLALGGVWGLDNGRDHMGTDWQPLTLMRSETWILTPCRSRSHQSWLPA